MTIHLRNGQNVFLDFRESAPAAISQKDLLNKKQQVKKNIFHMHALMWGVPGTVRGLNLTLKKYGTMPLKKVIAPAVRLAKKGYALNAQQISIMRNLYKAKNLPALERRDARQARGRKRPDEVRYIAFPSVI